MTESPSIYQSSLAKANDIFMTMVEAQFKDNEMVMTEYQKTCTLNAMSAISTLLHDGGMSINEIDHGNITNILLSVAALQLNASAEPREVYFQFRNKNLAKRGEQPRWTKEIEMGIEGDGNDALLARFGRNIKTIYPFWAVREGDGFEYPKHKGVSVEAPSWSESGRGKVIHVVYPVEMNDGTINYYIGEREDVKKNLLAHMTNNLMRDKQKSTKLEKIQKKAADMTLDQILDDQELVELGGVSPAWREPQSRETMVIRKMRNNVVKKIPKDFSSGFVSMEYQKTDDYEYKAMRRDVTDKANSIDFDTIPKPKVIDEQSTVISPEVPTHTVEPVTTAAESEPDSATIKQTFQKNANPVADYIANHPSNTVDTNTGEVKGHDPF